MLDQLESVEKRYEELSKLLADPAIASDYVKATQYAQERAELDDVVKTFRRYKRVDQQLSDTRALLEEDLGRGRGAE
jgi:peptide chain release factor 1